MRDLAEPSKEISEWEQEELMLSALPDVQRIVLKLKKKKYPEDIIELAEDLASEVALCDADTEEKEEEKDVKKMSDKELEESHYKSVEKSRR